jgi:hypothetical protein
MSIQIYENDQYQNDINTKPKVIAEINTIRNNDNNRKWILSNWMLF